MNKRILIIEDDRVLAPLIQQFLEDNFFEVKWADNGISGWDYFQKFKPDLVILDIMLPGKDGLTLCQEIRKHSQAGILMLTARGDEYDRVLGLELGADDYLTKPFGLKELLARIKAILRRYDLTPVPLDNQVRTFGPFRLSLENRQLYRGKQLIELTRSEFDILNLMTLHPGKVFERDTLLDCIKGGETEAFDRAVDMHISNLRKKIEINPKSPELIKTVWGVGYQFNA